MTNLWELLWATFILKSLWTY